MEGVKLSRLIPEEIGGRPKVPRAESLRYTLASTSQNRPSPTLPAGSFADAWIGDCVPDGQWDNAEKSSLLDASNQARNIDLRTMVLK